VAAQQFWQFLTVRQIAVVRVNAWPAGVPAPVIKAVGPMIPPLPAGDLEQARWRVHYDPRLPQPGILSGSPRLSTTFALSAGTLVHVADLELALRAVGIAGQTVPPAWDGAQLGLHTSPLVIAEWPDIVLVQSLPLTLTAPASFDFPAFSALILRILGVEPDEAQLLAKRMGTTPPWLAPIDRNMEERATIESVALKSGPATLVQQMNDKGAVERTTLMWSVPDRVYLLTGSLSRDLTIATANAVQ
jgi:hypothetical protein